MGSNKPPPTRGPFASIHNPNPGLHYGAPHPSSARELGKARELDQGIDMALVGPRKTINLIKIYLIFQLQFLATIKYSVSPPTNTHQLVSDLH